jgi:hypothetical protein
VNPLVASIGAVDPSWSALLRVYVGGGRPLGVTAFTEALGAVQRREGLEATYGRARTYNRLADTTKGTQPDAVWEEALALQGKAPWLSGLLGLLAAGHFADATGVIACCQIPVDAARFLAMIDSYEAAVYITPFDHVLPLDSAYFSVRVAPNNLKPFVESGAITLKDEQGLPVTSDNSINAYVTQEAARLEERRDARSTWQMPSEVHDALAAGRRAWQQLQGTSKLEGHLRRAYTTARDTTFPHCERKKLWHEDITRWIFAHLHDTESNGFGLIQLADMINNPQSLIARDVQTALQIGSHGNKALRNLVNGVRRRLKNVELSSGTLGAI